jgi:putative ABC transport system substrate-binding protein
VAPELHVELVPIAVHKAEQFGSAFSALTRSSAHAVLVLDDPFMGSNGTAVVRLATKAHLPVACGAKNLATQGALICYTAQFAELFRQAAGYVVKILKGAKPAELPVEQPTKFELVVNLKTAKALGITIPQSILLRADEVIR